MFLVESNAAQGVAVVLLGPPSSDADWREYTGALDELNLAVSPSLRPVLLQVIRGAAMPNPTTRRELAALRGRIRPDVINVVVSSSPILRNVQTALDWLRKPHYDSTIHATPAAAYFYLERQLGEAAKQRIDLVKSFVRTIERRAAA